jgi:hypothetical protein
MLDGSWQPTPPPQLIRIETDRRLGHEWDEWDGPAAPQHRGFLTAGLFFRYAA